MKLFRILFLLSVVAVLGFWTVDAAWADEVSAEPTSTILPPSEVNSIFSIADLPEQSFLDRSWYGRLADFTKIYAEPSRNATIVRTAGDGFLYVSLMGQAENEGETWYIINSGEYVLADDITIAKVSTFQGVQVDGRPRRPFGWMVSDKVRPSTKPGVDPDQTYPRLDRYTFFEVLDAVEASDGWIWYNIGDGRWMKQTHVSLVDWSPRPEGVPEGAYWTEVDLYEQTFAAYVGDDMVFATLISSGLNAWPTNEGLYQVEDRWSQVKMSGAEGKVDYYYVEDVPHTMYFNMERGIALHGAYWHDRFGFKHSHGCVNMPPRDSEWVFNWSEQSDDKLWVSVATSIPHTIFDLLENDRPRPKPIQEHITEFL